LTPQSHRPHRARHLTINTILIIYNNNISNTNIVNILWEA